MTDAHTESSICPIQDLWSMDHVAINLMENILIPLLEPVLIQYYYLSASRFKYCIFFIRTLRKFATSFIFPSITIIISLGM